jgi:hypothetical protein
MCKHPGDVFVFFFFFFFFFFSSDFSRANELQLDVLFFKSTGSSGSSISPSRTFARSLAASYPALLHPKTKKNLPQGRQQQQLTGSSRSCNKKEQSQKTAVAEEVEEEKKSLLRRKHRETETERNTH